MKLSLVVAWGMTILGSTTAIAQDLLTGTYKGNYEVQTVQGPQRWGVTLIISSVDDGKVKGAATLHQGNCRGDYPVEGAVKDNQIGVRATAKGGLAGDCTIFFKGKVDGNRFVGNMGKYEVELRK